MGSLLLGIDLGKYHSQISVYDEKKGEMISVSPCPSEDGGLIPAVPGVIANAEYFKKLLLLVRTYYPSDTIAKLVVTLENKNELVEQAIYQALEKLGVGKDRVFLQSYEESYITYALSQKKDLWLNDVGLFDFNELIHDVTIDDLNERLRQYFDPERSVLSIIKPNEN